MKLDNARLNQLGTRVYAKANGSTQLQVISAGNNYVSQQPHEVHFGLADVAEVEDLRIVWTNGQEQIFSNVPVNRLMVIGDASSPIPTLSLWGQAILILALISFGLKYFKRRLA